MCPYCRDWFDAQGDEMMTNPPVCDFCRKAGRVSYVVHTKPWDKGLEIHIYEDGKFFGMTQTHEGYPDDTVEVMARGYIISAKRLPSDAEIVIRFASEIPVSTDDD